MRFKKEERNHASDKEKVEIQEKKKENTLSTKKNKASFKNLLLFFYKFPSLFLLLFYEHNTEKILLHIICQMFETLKPMDLQIVTYC